MDVMEVDENDFYHHSGSGQFDSSESNSEEDELQETSYDGYNMGSPQGHYYGYNSRLDSEGGAYPRFIQTQNSEEEEDTKGQETEAVDPGAFRYNKRVFVTALPCLLLTLVMTGETLLLMVTIGGLIIVLMTQMGEDVSKRCVVVFALLFIPCHILVVGTVLPLLWLTVWNLFLVGIVNLFCILTGAWIIIQFVAFRKEEPSMCAMIEQILFSLYPCICSALVTWVLSTVVSLPMVPFIFIAIWFVCLQLYMLPAVSSFKLTETADEDLNVLQQPTIIAIVITFVVSGPALHVVSTWAGTSTMGLFSLSSLALLCMLLCLGLFLSTLLSLRQLCEYLGWPHLMTVQVRWVSGVGVLLLCYPVLQQLGLVSHFLLSLPVAVAGFTALALTLNLKTGKTMSLLLMAGLMLLLCLWLSHLPWALTYYFLGAVPMRVFYVLVAANFVLCVLAIFAAWHNSTEVFGFLLLLQTIGITVCEIGLYQAGLYSLPTFQLTGIVAAYTLYRLYVSAKLTRSTATVTSAVQLTKTALSALGYLLKVETREGSDTIVKITAMDFMTLLLFIGALVWMFVYETKEEVTLWDAGKHLTLLMVAMGISAQSFLIPIGQLLLQDVPTLADLVGLWYGLGSVLVLLYGLQHNESTGVLNELMKVAMVLGGVGALVMVMQPQFALTLFALYQWTEVFSILLIAALLATRVEVGFSQTLVTAGLLGICPGIHTTFLLYWEEVTMLHFTLIAAITCILLAFLIIIVKIQEVSDAAERFFKLGTLSVTALLVAVLAVDLINLERRDTIWDYPAWRMALGVMAIVSLSLKVLAMKLGPQHLPLTKKEDHSLPLIPIIGNLATVSAVLLARTQGPHDGLLHDLWCSASSVFLIALQRDPLLLTSLSPSNRATPTIMAAVATLVFSTLVQSRLWLFSGGVSIFFGFLEILAVLASLPVYVVLAGIMWKGEIWSEQAVVFTMPCNAFLFLLGTSYTAWALAVAGFVCGVGMMMIKLPLLPYNYELMQR